MKKLTIILLLVTICNAFPTTTTLQDILNNLTRQGESVEIDAQFTEVPAYINWIILYRQKGTWFTYSLVKEIANGANGVVDAKDLPLILPRFFNPPGLIDLTNQVIASKVKRAGGPAAFQLYVNAYPEEFRQLPPLVATAYTNLGVILPKQ